MSTRRRGWIRRRAGATGKPADGQLFTQKEELLRSLLPYDLFCWRTQRRLEKTLDHCLYSLKPKHNVFSQFPIISDNFHLYLLYGDIQLKPDIARLSSNGVVFEGEDHETPVDTVICATGYQYTLPFIDCEVLDVNDPDDIFQFIFPLRPKHQTLALIGYATPDGAVFPIFEMQARVAVQVFAGYVQLPSKEKMKAQMKKKRQLFNREFYTGYRKLIHVRWMTYFNELGSFIGARPNFFYMLLTDPHLFWHCFFGPMLPFQFRLRGPHPWSEARRTILDYEWRIAAPLNRKKPPTVDCCDFQKWKNVLWIIVPTLTVGCAYAASSASWIAKVQNLWSGFSKLWK